MNIQEQPPAWLFSRSQANDDTTENAGAIGAKKNKNKILKKRDEMLLSSEELCDFGIASLRQYNVEYYSGLGFHIIYGRGDRKNKISCLTFTRSTRNDDTKENVVFFSLSLSLLDVQFVR